MARDGGEKVVIVLGPGGHAATHRRWSGGDSVRLALLAACALGVATGLGYWLGSRGPAVAMEPPAEVVAATPRGAAAADAAPVQPSAPPPAPEPDPEPEPTLAAVPEQEASPAPAEAMEAPVAVQPDPAPARPGPALLVAMPGAEEPVELRPLSSDGQPQEPDYGALRELFACKSVGGAPATIEPALVEALVAAQQHFERPLQILGGRCARHADEHGSAAHHRSGRAVDIRLRGVSTGRLAPWLQERGIGGVGRYKRTGVVHIDLRSGGPEYWEPEQAEDGASGEG